MKRADQRKHHYIYKITKGDTGRFYIGMHSTDDLDDGYFGSGKIITASIKKHGKDKHHKEILEHLPTRESLKLREKEIVNEELLGDKLCMNLKLGGIGGSHGKEAEAWKRPGFKEEVALLQSIGTKRKWQDPEYISKQSMLRKRNWATPEYRAKMAARDPTFAGHSHTAVTKKRIGDANAIHQAGQKNSQFGTCWITKDSKSMKIKKEELGEYLLNGFIKGRSMAHPTESSKTPSPGD
jgi:hypothetical protein